MAQMLLKGMGYHMHSYNLYCVGSFPHFYGAGSFYYNKYVAQNMLPQQRIILRSRTPRCRIPLVKINQLQKDEHLQELIQGFWNRGYSGKEMLQLLHTHK